MIPSPFTATHQLTVQAAETIKYRHKITALGAVRYQTFVTDGHTADCSADDKRRYTEKTYSANAIGVKPGTEKFITPAITATGKNSFISSYTDCPETWAEKIFGGHGIST